MVFSSLVFLFCFLPLLLAVYFICPKGMRNFLLLVASLIFYAWGEPRYILIMLFSTVFDYCNGRLIEFFEKKNDARRKKRVLIISVVGNLLILCFFKYTNLIIESWNDLSASHIPLLNIALPIGISFYTFQTMSYTIDVYRGLVKAQHNIISFGMYVCMFPQLIAGPIVRYQTIAEQVDDRSATDSGVAMGIQRFLIGLGKKVLFANQIGTLWTEVSGGNLVETSMVSAWLGAIAYTLQIYFDFSGYSDMAIGLGMMFGFDFPENFKHPYESKSITEFWRRWHITLGTWFREYVYIPLGGNRKGTQRQIINLFIVWSLTGIWHGASWNFAIWGLYFFALLLCEKLFLLKKMERWPAVFRHIYAKFFIILGWVIFAVTSFGDMGKYFRAMSGMAGGICDSLALYQIRNYGLFLVLLIIASTRIPVRCIESFKEFMLREDPEFVRTKGVKLGFLIKSIFSFVVLALCIGMLVSGSYNPFLYFRF